MGFADEVKSVFHAPSPAAPPAPEAQPAPEAPEAPKGDAGMGDLQLSVGSAAVDDKAKSLPQPPPLDPDKRMEQKPRIKIGTREFVSYDEAMDYAQQLEVARAQDQAYIEGVKSAQKEEPKAQPKTLEEEVEEMIFENPKEAIAKLTDGITKKIFAQYDKITAEQAQAQAQAKARESAWGTFYSENSDLSSADDAVKFVYQRDFEALKDLPVEKGLKELADRTRKMLRISREASLPKTELPSKPAVMPGASGESTGAAADATPKEKFDFISQVNKLRRRA